MGKDSASRRAFGPGATVRNGHGGLLRLRRRYAVLLLAALAVACLIALMNAVLAPPARSASTVETVAAQLRKGPVYVDRGAAGQLTSARAKALADRIRAAGRPVFVAVLPATARFPAQTVLRDLRSAVGITGLYAVRLGDRFDAGADPQVIPPTAVDNLVGQVRRSSGGDAAAELDSFVDGALPQVEGHAPDSWGGRGSGVGAVGGIAAGAVVLALVVAAYVVVRRRRKAYDARQRDELRQLRAVVDEDITAYGEELDRLDFRPAAPASDDLMRADYAHALDAYERAKSLLAAARSPEDVEPVTRALEEGRFRLATLDARRGGTPLPERRPPCFFDPRHGPSVRDVSWAPPGGAPRDVPACAADATRIADGDAPMTRTLDTPRGPRPYWNAGPAYAPYAGGYFGAGLLPGLLVGTLLGGSLFGPGYGGGWYDGADGGGPEGGDYSGSDFDPGDFGGGGGGGGFGDGDGGGFGGGFG